MATRTRPLGDVIGDVEPDPPAVVPAPAAPTGDPYREVKLSVILSESDRDALTAWAADVRTRVGRRSIPATDVVRALVRELVSNDEWTARTIERLRR